MVKIVFVVARALNGIIGADGRLPWKLSSDLKFFRQTTMGRPLIMGRKTFESIGKPLPGRDTIVLTRSKTFHASGVFIADSVAAALEAAQRCARQRGVDETMVVGGAEIYGALMPFADQLIVTEVQATPAGDVSFPAPLAEIWREIVAEPYQRGPKDDADFIIRRYERR